jgi:hypothetical protein
MPRACHSQGAWAVAKGRERSTRNPLTSATTDQCWSDFCSALLCKQGDAPRTEAGRAAAAGQQAGSGRFRRGTDEAGRIGTRATHHIRLDLRFCLDSSPYCTARTSLVWVLCRKGKAERESTIARGSRHLHDEGSQEFGSKPCRHRRWGSPTIAGSRCRAGPRSARDRADRITHES